VCFCSGRARPCPGAASVASEMTSFTSRWWMRAHPAGRYRGRQCPRDDHRPCFSHRVSSARGVTRVRGHQRINDVTLRQWEPLLETLHTHTHTQTKETKFREKPIFTSLKERFQHIELPAKLLDYFLQSNKSNINQPTTHQLSTHPKILPAPKSLTSAHEVMNQL